MKVAFQGECGAYSEIAALKFFPDAELIPMRLFQDIFDALKESGVNSAVVPVENSIEGSVNEIYDLLLDVEKKITRELFLRINHCLITILPDCNIKKVYSHPQAIAQCRNYIKRNNFEPIPTYDTAGAVRMIKEKNMTDSAAIASKRAAQLYKMTIMEEGIEDRKNNFTRFLVLSDESTQSTGNDRTSIIFGLQHVPGTLFGILQVFAMNEINLTKIESRPTKEKPWEYNFYLDIEGHIREKKIEYALTEIRKNCTFMKIVGSYRQGSISSI